MSARNLSAHVVFVLLLAVSLFACTNQGDSSSSDLSNSVVNDNPADIADGEETSEEDNSYDEVDSMGSSNISVTDEEPSVDLTENQVQMNSLAMLNYLTVLSQDVNASKGSRLKLESMYADLFDNTRPDRIDRATLDQIIDISDTIYSYRLLGVKRERLEYLYEQKKAAAIRSAIPDPISILNVVRSRSLPQAILSLGYVAFDAYAGYKDAVSDAKLEYLTEGWELDDEQSATLHAQRKSTFIYMVKMVNDYGLPGDLALSEADVEKLVTWKNNENTVGRIQFLESNRETYKAYGGYWLLLANSYFEQGDYQKCLEATNSYESVRTNILRRDHDYAAVLPLAISAASEVLNNDEYIAYAEKRIPDLLHNSEDDNWQLRYLAAQFYIDLNELTGNKSYLERAYKIALDNVNTLVGKQREENASYVADFVEAKTPDGATKEQKKEIKEYNKKAKAEHGVALPPAYQPLLVNCDLLFALADELNVSEADRARIDGVLHPGGDSIFLTSPLDERYRMSGSEHDSSIDKVKFDGSRITLPAVLVSDYSNIKVTTGEDEKEVSGEWEVKEVKRAVKGEVESFEATFENKDNDVKKSFTNGDVVTVTISDGEGSGAVVRSYSFKVKVEERPSIVPDAYSFERV